MYRLVTSCELSPPQSDLRVPVLNVLVLKKVQVSL